MNFKTIDSISQKLEKDMIQFLKEIITIPSFCGEESEIIRRIKTEMEKLDYDDVFIDPFGNLIGKIGSGDRIIAFDGHADTVNIGDLSNWKIDPLGAYEDKKTVFGRGAADQKGGLAAAIYSIPIIKAIGFPKNMTIFVIASVMEEDFEGLGWDFIMNEDKIIPDMVILTEPTHLEIKTGHRGRLEIKVEIKGKSCHGSKPHLGENAIYKTVPLIQEIEKLNVILAPATTLGKGSIVVTGVESSSPSLCAIPDKVLLHLDRRLTTGETPESALAEIAGLQSVRQNHCHGWIPSYQVKSFTGLVRPQKAYYPAWLMDDDHPLVKKAQDTYRLMFNRSPKMGTWDFSTNGTFTQGIAKIPTIGFGPGNEVHAHTVMDQVRKVDVANACRFYAALVLNNP